MAGLRHDAAKCREAARSELIRHSLGILTPEEQTLKDRREEEKRLAEAKDATKGTPLFDL